MANDLILVVDADEKSQRVLTRCLQRAGYALQLARTSQEALAWLDANDGDDPSLIICGTELPGASGFELCAQVKAKLDWEPIPFLFLADADDPDLRQRAFDLGVEDVLIRPVYVKEITTRVQLLLQRREQALLAAEAADEVQGDLSDTPVLDVLQTLEDQSQTGTLEFERNGRRGVIHARQGRILDASVGNLRGADAVFRLMQWPDGAYTFTPLPALQRPDRVQKTTSDLLIEGMQRLDQWDDLTDSGHALDRVHEVNYKLLADHLRNLPDEVNGIIRLFDGYRTVQDVIDDSTLESVRTLQVVQKLIDQGLIYDVTPAQDAASAQAAAADPLTDWLDMEVGETTGKAPGKRGQVESEADKVRRRREERKRRKLDSKRRRTQHPDTPQRRVSQRIASRPLPEPIPAEIPAEIPATATPAPAPAAAPMSELEQLQAQLALIEAQTQHLQDQKEQLRDEVQAEAQAEAQAQAELEQLAQQRAEEQARLARERERAEREAEALRQRIAQAQQLAAKLAAERAQLSEQLAQQRQRTRQTSKALEDLEHGAPIDPSFLPGASLSAVTAAQRDAENKAREAAARQAQEAAERQAQQAREREAQAAAEQAAKAEAARQAHEEAERQAQQDRERAEREALALAAAREAEAAAARQAQEDAERRIREETERRVRDEIERRLREEAERKAREEAERKAQEEAERKAQEDAEREARAEVERKAQEEAERAAKAEAERKAQEEAERKAQAEAERKAKEDAERAAKAEAERKAQEEAERKAQEDAERAAKAEAERKAQAEADEAARAEEENAKAAAVSALSQAAKNFKPPQERTRTRDLSKEKASVAAVASPDVEVREAKDPDLPAPAPAPAAPAQDQAAEAAAAPAAEASPEDDFFKNSGADADFWSDGDQDNLYPAEGSDNTPKIIGALLLIVVVGLVGYVVYTKDKGGAAPTDAPKSNGATVADADAGADASAGDAGEPSAEVDGGEQAPVALDTPLSDDEAPKRAEELAQTRIIKPTRELANLIDGRDPVTGEPLVPVDTQAGGDETADAAGAGDDGAKPDDAPNKDDASKVDATKDPVAKTDAPPKTPPPKKDDAKDPAAKPEPKGPRTPDPVVTPTGPDPAMAAMNDQAKQREARNAINKAKVLLRSNPDGAIQELNKAASLAPGSPQINLMLGQAYRAKRNYTQAIDYFERALRANPNNLAAIEMLATCYMAAGQRPKAFALYRRYLQLRPTGPQSEGIRKILIANGQAVN